MLFGGGVSFADRQPEGSPPPGHPETIEGDEGVCVMGTGRLAPCDQDISSMGKARSPVTAAVDSDEERTAHPRKKHPLTETNAATHQPTTIKYGRYAVGDERIFILQNLF